MPKNLSIIAYVLLIIIGAIALVIPGLGHICIACGTIVDTILAVVAVVVGVAGLAVGRQAMA
jgi:hypothetical protein